MAGNGYYLVSGESMLDILTFDAGYSIPNGRGQVNEEMEILRVIGNVRRGEGEKGQGGAL